MAEKLVDVVAKSWDSVGKRINPPCDRGKGYVWARDVNFFPRSRVFFKRWNSEVRVFETQICSSRTHIRIIRAFLWCFVQVIRPSPFFSPFSVVRPTQMLGTNKRVTTFLSHFLCRIGVSVVPTSLVLFLQIVGTARGRIVCLDPPKWKTLSKQSSVKCTEQTTKIPRGGKFARCLRTNRATDPARLRCEGCDTMKSQP